MTANTLTNLPFSADVLKLNPALTNAKKVTYRVKRERLLKAGDLDGFDSQLERDFNAELNARWSWDVRPHGWTFHLPGGVDYTPDFIARDICLPGKIIVYEVKGEHVKNTRDSRTRFRLAAGLYPWLAFVWVTRTKAGKWIEKEYRA